ncbi:GAF domain-containing protein [Deinococcus sp. KSM4-11]|uniref:GAF domain-containing protein n=1 Tax=Deinococcus sp. KSM4-11 TaxID=2568654 RepID=UPI001454C63A|nr:GAF domain-containing protein [Deinococcus sp. KSM4-11]
MTTPDLPPLLTDGVIDATRAATFMQTWWRLSQTLGHATTRDEVIDSVVREGVHVLGADAGTVLLPNADDTALIVKGTRGYEPQYVDGWHTIPLSRSLPSTAAYRTRQPVYSESIRGAIDTYPALGDVLGATTGSLAALPLLAGDEILGVLSLAFHRPRTFDPTDRAFLLFLASQCALALQRNAALENAQRLNAQLRFLAEAGTILSRSLNLSEILASIAQLAIPEVADWCVIYLPDHGQLEPVTIAHQDPSMVALLQAYTHAHPTHVTSDSGVGRAYLTGQAELLPAITDEMYDASPMDATEKAEVRRLQLRSIITVPMIAAGHVVGVLGLGRTDLDRAFTAADLEFAQQVANRAGKAVENARLHQELERELHARLAMQQALDDTNAHLEDRVRERTEELQQLNDELQAFAHSVSHDLRTPIRHIASFADLLTRHLPSENDRAAQALMQIKHGAQRLSATVDGLLTLSRSSQQPLARTAVCLDEVVGSVISHLNIETTTHPVEWRLSGLSTVAGDAGLLTLVVQNLLHNAVKFTRGIEHPVIEVTATRSDTGTTITVQDNGPGFDPEYAHKLFQPFQRLHHTNEFEGTGLGLANVRRIIQRHGGQVWAASVPGQGAVFSFTLPD